MNLAKPAHLNPGPSGSRKATIWFTFMLAGSICCIGGASWIEIQDYAPTASQWPGIALILNTCLITGSALLFFFGK